MTCHLEDATINNYLVEQIRCRRFFKCLSNTIYNKGGFGEPVTTILAEPPAIVIRSERFKTTIVSHGVLRFPIAICYAESLAGLEDIHLPIIHRVGEREDFTILEVVDRT